MKIAICGSLDFTEKMKEIADILKQHGHEVVIPHGAELILSGKETIESIREKGSKQKIEGDVIRSYYDKISKADAILVLNYDKRGVKNYIGGNTLMEIGFAHVLNKKIFLMNPIPEIPYYQSEIEAVKPVVIYGDLSKIV
ncbi:MAG: nucleoside 2-deoxyribosyltransferase [Candidatus Jacksonbacteria bacterium]|nr:nucleoside 2-deoxyribosyltransferase [Candidatus Jacksonbacteria bacterium]